MVHTRHFAYANQSMEKLGLRHLKIRTKYKYQFTFHLVYLSVYTFPCCARDLVTRVVSHSRLGEHETKYVEYGI